MGAVEGTVQFLPSTPTDLESRWRVLEKVHVIRHISRDCSVWCLENRLQGSKCLGTEVGVLFQ